MITEKDIIEAYTRIRTIDNTIPDEVLDFIKNASIKQLRIGGVSKSFAVGKEVVIVDNKHGHQFALGEKVTLLKQEEDGEWKAVNDKNEHWWIEEIEANVC